jgi:phage terminase Nu1 subunit (DNA packaging protein)
MTKKPIPSKRADGVLNALCAALHLQKRRVSTLLRQGMPDSVEAALLWRSSRASEVSVEDLRKSRKALIDLQAERARVDLAARRGELISGDHVEEGASAIGSVMKSMLQRMANDCPPRLEGLTANEIKKELVKENDKILAGFADELRKYAIETSHPENK